MAKAKRYTNVVLSSNPCPSCVKASGKTMILAKWKTSEYGLTDSKKRLCNRKTANCHCIFVPAEMVDLLPAIGKRVKIRGDEITDIRPIVDIHPNEETLKDLMDRYNEEIGRLPPAIYDMAIDDIIPYLEGLLK